MTHRFAEIAFTDGVKRAQEHYGTREQNEKLLARGGPNARLGPREIDFIAARDSFYMASVSETGWPYVQHRGGPTGFVQVLGPTTLAFADFRGNLQYVSVGNLSYDDRVSLILLDYPRRRRLKILGRARSVDAADAAPQLLVQVKRPGYSAQVERVMLIEVEAFDWNCSQHIAPRFTQLELEEVLKPLRARIELLESELRKHGISIP